MSFGFENLRNDAVNKNEFKSTLLGENYGVQSPFVSGLGATRKVVGNCHPLELSQKNYAQNQLRSEMIMLRNTQGIHAPMRLAMELKTAEKVGRLPFLPSSLAMKDVILGRDEEIGPEDIFNIPEFREQMGQPLAVVEKSIGIL